MLPKYLSPPKGELTTPTQTNFTKLLSVMAALALVLVVGTIGFVIIENMAPFDALYMTVITLSTVGFGEITPLHDAGRVLAMLLIVFGVGLGAYAASTIGQIILEGQLKQVFGRKKMEKKLKKMSNHHIIAGLGRVGRQVAEEFARRKVPFVIIEKEPEPEMENGTNGFVFLKGEATDDKVLLHAGVERARTLISTLPDEAQNVYLTLTARAMNKDLHIIARADVEGGEKKLMRAGADHVVSPHVLGGHRMALASLRPNVVDFMHITTLGEGGLSIEEVVIPDGCRLVGKCIMDSGLKNDYEATIIGIKKTGEQMSVAPGPQTLLETSDTLVLIGPTDGLERLGEELSI
ncbi:MAG: potassium channel protein [candidate division Zixibacteria bacterium]|nr:potassium channel protein [candidate division Zixibacteria bacterium]MDH3938090.1 potassium channel protein [candidate division Zixibacteria bacterium]MDH4034930.1 potassium channel protein [candidate division Zixibacteria bacterium]